MTTGLGAKLPSLEQSIKEEARRLGFVLAGVTTPDPPPHAAVFESWLSSGRHGSMRYLSAERSRRCREDPLQLMPECKSIIVLAAPYSNPSSLDATGSSQADRQSRGRVAAYAWGDDYHDVLPRRMRALVSFMESRLNRQVRSCCFTDSAPLLERDLAQRAGLGWIGKNTSLINPRRGSYVLLAEILLDVELRADLPLATDHCGKCTRCIDACPTNCILPDRTIDSRRCISYLTIELKDSISLEVRPEIGDWVFGCDICQIVCPWNRFAPRDGDDAFAPRDDSAAPPLAQQLQFSEEDFRRRFRDSPVRRAKYAGYLRNLAVAAGNVAGLESVPTLRLVERGGGLAQTHAAWAIHQISRRAAQDE